MIVDMVIRLSMYVDEPTIREKKRLAKDYISTDESPEPDQEWFAEEKAMQRIDKAMEHIGENDYGITVEEVR